MILIAKNACATALFLAGSYIIPVAASTTVNDVTSQPSMSPSNAPTQCVDEQGWRTGPNANAYNCTTLEQLNYSMIIAGAPIDWCGLYNTQPPYNGKVITEACCFCGGSDFQLVAPSLNPTDSPSQEPSAEPSQVPSVTPSVSTQPSGQPSALPSAQESSSPSTIPSKSPSETPSTSPSKVASESPSSVPSGIPSDVPTRAPSVGPSSFPSMPPSEHPSSTPSAFPSDVPTRVPSVRPSDVPTRAPSMAPSQNPSKAPSDVPTSIPSTAPSAVPTVVHSSSPSSSPTCVDEPGWQVNENVPLTCAVITAMAQFTSNVEACANTLQAPYKGKVNWEACCACGGNDSRLVAPSTVPSASPSELPSLSVSPSSVPTSTPSAEPSAKPSSSPSSLPSAAPSLCFNDPGWKFYEDNGCEVVEDAVAKMSDFCDFIGHIVHNSKTVKQACCICNGFYAYEMPSNMPSVPSASVSLPS